MCWSVFLSLSIYQGSTFVRNDDLKDITNTRIMCVLFHLQRISSAKSSKYQVSDWFVCQIGKWQKWETSFEISGYNSLSCRRIYNKWFTGMKAFIFILLFCNLVICYKKLKFKVKIQKNKKYNCSGPPAFKSQKERYQSDQKLLHDRQH